MIWLYHSSFNGSPIEGHLSCFQFGATMNKVAISFIYRLCVNVFLGLMPRSVIVRKYYKQMFTQ